jgi:hypothetical protein
MKIFSPASVGLFFYKKGTLKATILIYIELINTE